MRKTFVFARNTRRKSILALAFQGILVLLGTYVLIASSSSLNSANFTIADFRNDGQISISNENTSILIPPKDPQPTILDPRDSTLRSKAIAKAKDYQEGILQKEKKLEKYQQNMIDKYIAGIQQEEDLKNAKIQKEAEEKLELKYYSYYEDDDTKDATVVGQSHSQEIRIYKRFVGSLRYHGFKGNVIIGIEEQTSKEIEDYLLSQNVTVKKMLPIECNFESAKDRQKCYRPYPNIKREWAHFPLIRDWLAACDSCFNGPVLYATVDHTLFQKNPFGKSMPVVKRLHLYEQHPAVDVSKTPAAKLLKPCVDIDLEEEMKEEDPEVEPRGILSSATAIGQRDDIIDYLGLVYTVLRRWMQKSECHVNDGSGRNGGGTAALNYLRIKEMLPYRTRIMVHRTGIVSNIDYEGRIAFDGHVHIGKFMGLTPDEAKRRPYDGSMYEKEFAEKGTTKYEGGWIDTDYMVTDSDGSFIDVFFQKSAVVYGYDTFGPPFMKWFDYHMNITKSDDASSQLEPPQFTTNEDSQLHEDTSKPKTKEQKEKEGYYMDKTTEALAKNNTKPERAQKEEITSDHKNTTGLVTTEVVITKGVEDDGQQTPQDAPLEDDDKTPRKPAI